MVLFDRKRYQLIVNLSLFIIFFINACTTTQITERFTSITLREWLDLGLFKPVILYPPPDNTQLQLGPFLAQTAGYVELYYTEDFIPDKLLPGYQLYESARPLPIGENILPKYAARHKNVVIKEMTLNFSGKDHIVEIRHNHNYPDDGVANFQIEGTYVAYYWQNMGEDVALNELMNHLIVVQPDDIDIIATFDKE